REEGVGLDAVARENGRLRLRPAAGAAAAHEDPPPLEVPRAPDEVEVAGPGVERGVRLEERARDPSGLPRRDLVRGGVRFRRRRREPEEEDEKDDERRRVHRTLRTG